MGGTQSPPDVLTLTDSNALRNLNGPQSVVGLSILFAKCGQSLSNGQRLENISWRLWSIPKLMSSANLSSPQQQEQSSSFSAAERPLSPVSEKHTSSTSSFTAYPQVPLMPLATSPGFRSPPPRLSTASSRTVGDIISAFDAPLDPALKVTPPQWSQPCYTDSSPLLPTPSTDSESQTGKEITVVISDSPATPKAKPKDDKHRKSGTATPGNGNATPQVVVVDPTPNPTPHPTPPATPFRIQTTDSGDKCTHVGPASTVHSPPNEPAPVATLIPPPTSFTTTTATVRKTKFHVGSVSPTDNDSQTSSSTSSHSQSHPRVHGGLSSKPVTTSNATVFGRHHHPSGLSSALAPPPPSTALAPGRWNAEHGDAASSTSSTSPTPQTSHHQHNHRQQTSNASNKPERRPGAKFDIGSSSPSPVSPPKQPQQPTMGTMSSAQTSRTSSLQNQRQQHHHQQQPAIASGSNDSRGSAGPGGAVLSRVATVVSGKGGLSDSAGRGINLDAAEAALTKKGGKTMVLASDASESDGYSDDEDDDEDDDGSWTEDDDETDDEDAAAQEVLKQKYEAQRRGQSRGGGGGKANLSRNQSTHNIAAANAQHHGGATRIQRTYSQPQPQQNHSKVHARPTDNDRYAAAKARKQNDSNAGAAARAAREMQLRLEEVQRQNELFEKKPKRSYSGNTGQRSGLLSVLMNPPPEVFPEGHPERQKSIERLERMRWSTGDVPTVRRTTNGLGMGGLTMTAMKMQQEPSMLGLNGTAVPPPGPPVRPGPQPTQPSHLPSLEHTNPREKQPIRQSSTSSGKSTKRVAIHSPPKLASSPQSMSMSASQKRRSMPPPSMTSRPPVAAPAVFANSKSPVAAPVAASISASVSSQGRQQRHSPSRNAPPDSAPPLGNGTYPKRKGPPQNLEMEESSDDDPDDRIQVSQSLAQQKLAALASGNRKPPASARPDIGSKRASMLEPLPMDDSPDFLIQPGASTSPASSSVATPVPLQRASTMPSNPQYPYNLPPPADPSTPRTTRRLMLRTEMSESLRQNLLWSRQLSTQEVTGPAPFKRAQSSGNVVAQSHIQQQGGISRKKKTLPTVKSLVHLTPKNVLQRERASSEERRSREERLREEITRERESMNRTNTLANIDYHTSGW